MVFLHSCEFNSPLCSSLSTALPLVFYSPCVMPSSSDQKAAPLRGELLGLISLLKNVRGSPFRDTAHKGIAAQINEGLFNSSYHCTVGLLRPSEENS